MSWKNDIDPAEITPEHIYRNRRWLMRRALPVSATVAAAAALAACGPSAGFLGAPVTTGAGERGTGTAVPVPTSGDRDELDDPVNTYEAVTNYNNYYEFSTEKEAPARLAKGF